MAFSQATILDDFQPQVRGNQVYISWSSSSPVGTWFQVYINRRFAWSGQRRGAWVVIPTGPVRIDIGAVGAGEQDTDFSAALPAAFSRRVQITWQAGTCLGSDLAGFRVYGSVAPGTGVDYSTALADITAYPASITTDGFGLGGFGSGGFGQSAGNYAWTSGPLAAGTWTFTVVPYDAAGNEGAAQTTTVNVAGPPRAPASFAGASTRLQYALLGFGQVGFGSRRLRAAGGYTILESQPLMSNTYTANTKLAMPAIGDTGWAVPVNGNCTLLDALAPIGGLAATTTEVPSASLNVAVAAGTYVKQDGTIGAFAGASSRAIAASSTQVLYLDLTNSGALAAAAAYPTTPHVRLATVVAGVGTISGVTDNRQCFEVVGSWADGVNIALGSAIGTQIGTAPGQKLGFFGKTPTTQPTMGAATAGATYTSNEQSMLQSVYNAVRALGLGS